MYRFYSWDTVEIFRSHFTYGRPESKVLLMELKPIASNFNVTRQGDVLVR